MKRSMLAALLLAFATVFYRWIPHGPSSRKDTNGRSRLSMCAEFQHVSGFAAAAGCSLDPTLIPVSSRWVGYAPNYGTPCCDQMTDGGQ
jgi:hypothetical protein